MGNLSTTSNIGIGHHHTHTDETPRLHIPEYHHQCRIIRGGPSLQSSTRLALPLLVVSLRWDADVRCYPQWNRGRRLTKIGAMYQYTPAESSPEGTRVWEHTHKHKVCLSASADVGELERSTREPKEQEYTKNGRSAIHIYVR